MEEKKLSENKDTPRSKKRDLLLPPEIIHDILERYNKLSDGLKDKLNLDYSEPYDVIKVQRGLEGEFGPEYLERAARIGNIDLVQWLVSPDRGDKRLTADRFTLYIAAPRGDQALLERLRLFYAQEPNKEEFLYYILYVAANCGDLELVKYLVSPDRGDKQLTADQFTLYAAANSGNIELVEWLISSERGDKQLTPDRSTFFIAARAGNQVLVERLLPFYQLELSKKDFHHYVLYAAVKSGNAVLVQWLLSDNHLIPVGMKLSDNPVLVKWVTEGLEILKKTNLAEDKKTNAAKDSKENAPQLTAPERSAHQPLRKTTSEAAAPGSSAHQSLGRTIYEAVAPDKKAVPRLATALTGSPLQPTLRGHVSNLGSRQSQTAAPAKRTSPSVLPSAASGSPIHTSSLARHTSSNLGSYLSQAGAPAKRTSPSALPSAVRGSPIHNKTPPGKPPSPLDTIVNGINGSSGQPNPSLVKRPSRTAPQQGTNVPEKERRPVKHEAFEVIGPAASATRRRCVVQ